MLRFPETFEQQVRDALGKLYNLTDLHDNPLAIRIAPHLHGLPRVQVVRRLLIDTIQQLNAGRDVDFRSTQQRHYVLLQMRYVEEQSVQEVAQQLLLGERHYYREHNKAIEALCYLLWQHLESAEQPLEPDTTITMHAEVELAYSNLPSQLTRLTDVLDGAIEATRGLAEKFNITIDLDKTVDRICWINAPALRQMVIQVLSHVAGKASPATTITISAEEAAVPEIRFAICSGNARLMFTQHQAEGKESLNSLLKTLNAKVHYSLQDEHLLNITVRFGNEDRLVLVIDDNPDAIRLMERFLLPSRYRVASAGQAEDGLQLAFKLLPQFIILDVMLPGRDGWEILQHLKNHPTTRGIPVIVCSVLDESTADLAFSLGADMYLHKPPGQVEFLRVLSQLER